MKPELRAALAEKGRCDLPGVLLAAAECAPLAKTGGLADVAGSLPPALAAQGVETAVILPLYRLVKERFADQLTFLCYDYVDLAWRHAYCGLFSMEKDGVTWYFLDNEQYFDRPELYGYVDDGERFGFFSRAVVKMLDHLEFWPDVIHCNDWQTALIPIYLKDDGVREDRYRSIRTVLTIHNIEYQGRYDPYCLGDLFGLDRGWVDDGTLLLDGDLAVMERTIRNMVGNVAGMICDGAKSSCALKVATAVGAGIQAVMLALDGSVVPGNEGITDDDIEVCIANLGRLGSTGMKEADKVILDIMLKKS